MKNTTSGGKAKPSQPMADDDFIVHSPRKPDGYTYLYNSTAEALMNQHGTVISAYLALCLFSDGQRKSHPSLQGLADLMRVSRDTAKRAVAQLEAIGVLRVDRPTTPGRGRASVYYLTRPDDPGNGAPAMHPNMNRIGGTESQKRGHPGAEKGAPAMHPQQEPVNKNKEQEHTTAPISGPDGKGRTQPAGGQTKEPVSTTVDTYWDDPQHGVTRRFQFQTIFDAYPKQENEQSAKRAWVTTIGTRMDGAAHDGPAKDLWLAVFYAVDWWAAKVTGKLGGKPWEDQYIITADKWIANEKWMDAPAGVRKGQS